MKIKSLLVIALFSLSFSYNYAQLPLEMERASSFTMPEVNDLRNPIKDVKYASGAGNSLKKLMALLPEVEKGYNKLIAAKLPAIFKDRQEKWNAGIKSFSASFLEFKKLADVRNPNPFLKAAAKLCENFAVLESILKISIPGSENFKKELFLLYNYYLPTYYTTQPEKARTYANTLTKYFKVLKDKGLPKEMQAKKNQYDAAISNLSKAIDDFYKALLADGKSRKSADQIKEYLGVVNKSFRTLEAVFE